MRPIRGRSAMRARSAWLLFALSFGTGCDGCRSSTQRRSPDAAGAASTVEGVPFDDVVLLEAGRDETCVVVGSGATYCAGGPLAAYDRRLSMARRVAGADHTTQLSIGASACAVQENGQVVCWGQSRNKVLPREGPGKKSDPVVIPGLPPASYVLGNEAAFPYWAFAKNESSVWQWGGTIFDGSFVAPTKAEGLILNDPVQVASSHNFFCARLRAGFVECWDLQGYLNEELIPSLKNRHTLGPADIVDIGVSYPGMDGPQVACMLDIEGQVACWGYVGEFLTEAEPLPRYPLVGPHRWRDIAMGSWHHCAVERDGTVWCMGNNLHGELGVAEPRRSAVPLKVPGVVGAKAVAVGYDHSCALLRNGSVVCWGSNYVGQCGASERAERVAPTAFLRFTGNAAGP